VPHIPICPPTSASKEALAVYEEFYTLMQFPSAPNFIMTQGHAHAVARGTWDLVRNVLVTGEIPRWIKEMMFVAISHERNCGYCVAAHVACCQMLKVDPEWLELATGNVADIPDPKLRDMLQFALKCARDPQALTTVDYALLRSHGLSTKETLEIVGMAGLAVYANILADATRMEADEMFGDYEPAVTLDAASGPGKAA
jgi:uncharacterized peroxidase-related enzyme